MGRHNCLSFCQEFLGRLRINEEFPAWVHGACAKSNRYRSLDCIVNAGWQVAKWWMIRSQDSEGMKYHKGQATADCRRRWLPETLVGWLLLATAFMLMAFACYQWAPNAR